MGSLEQQPVLLSTELSSQTIYLLFKNQVPSPFINSLFLFQLLIRRDLLKFFFNHAAFICLSVQFLSSIIEGRLIYSQISECSNSLVN